MNNVKDFLGDKEIQNEVVTLWASIFQASSEIIKQSNTYGFLTIEIIPDPNIHQILKSLKFVGNILDEVLSDMEDSEIQQEMELTRLVLNAKQQLLNLEKVAMSLKYKDEEEYKSSLTALKKQAAI